MRINWKVLGALILIVIVAYWAITSLLSVSYSGSGLNFPVGRGTVTVMNPSDAFIPAQLIGARSSSFTVLSSTEGLAGSSARQGTGAESTNIFEFELPPGTSEFTVTRGTNVNFVTQSETALDVTVQPLSSSELNTTMIAAVVIVLGALFYISRATGHRWMSILRRTQVAPPNLNPMPVAEAPTTAQGSAARSYGDNRV